MPPPLPAPQNRFELGLVLAGAISAGAYTAGVLDFLLEALDEWTAAKARGDSVPPHTLMLGVAAGASAGGMCAGQLAAVCNRDCPPMRAPLAATVSANVLFESWVNRIDIAALLGTTDAKDGVVESLLDSNVIDGIADVAFSPQTPARERPYLAPDFTVYTAVTNLRGVPYLIPFRANVPEGTVQGHDLARHQRAWQFELSVSGSVAAGVVPLDPQRGDRRGWEKLRAAAVASGAFPIGLRPRVLQETKADLSTFSFGTFTPQPPPSKAWDPAIEQLDTTSWPDEFAKLPTTAPMPYWTVDGGVVDNEPLELVRLKLAGSNRVNPRAADEVKGITLLIDPFVGWGKDAFAAPPMTPDPQSRDHPPPLVPAPLSLLSNAMSVMGAWINQARFKPEELRLAKDESCYSRFLIAPTRKAGEKTILAPKALACGALGGFSGFLDRGFRVHDYVLGRRNCQQFLRRHLALPVTTTTINPRFSAGGPAVTLASAQAAGWAARGWLFQENGAWFIPLIPLVGTAVDPIGPHPWPSYDEARLKNLSKQMARRFDFIAGVMLDRMKPWWARSLAKAAWWGASGSVVDWATAKVRAELTDFDLLPKSPPAP